MQSLHTYLEHGNLLRVLAWSIMKLTWSGIDLGATWIYSCQELEFKYFLKITEKLNKSFIHWWIFLGRKCVLFNFVFSRRPGFDPWVGKNPWSRVWQPIPVFLPGESTWTDSRLAGYSPCDRKETDTTERLSTAQHVFSNVYKWIDFYKFISTCKYIFFS